MEEDQQIKECQTNKMSYCAWHEWAENMVARGEKQTFCATCSRWQFKQEQCDIYREYEE